MKTYIPYFRDNKVIAPPVGYFILPGHVLYGEKFEDQYYYDYDWEYSCEDLKYTVKNRCDKGYDISCYARPIKGNEELYNQMAFLPEKIVTPPEGYYILSKTERVDTCLAYNKYTKIWTEIYNGDVNNTEEYYNRYIKTIAFANIAFARKIKNMTYKNFQIKIHNSEQSKALRDLVTKYGYSYNNFFIEDVFENKDVYITFHSKEVIGWNPRPYGDFHIFDNIDEIRANLDQLYPNENIDVKENTMKTDYTGEYMNMVNEKVDYAKYPNFAVKVKNDNEAVMILALAEKYGLKRVSGDFFPEGTPKANNILFYRADSIKNKIRVKGEIRCINNFTYEYGDDNIHIYETINWDAIIKHFEAPVVEIKDYPVVNDYTMEKYIKGDAVVKFGCANISIGMLESFNSILENDIMFGNRKAISITLDSGKVITKEQIKEILEYVDWADKQ